jgi:ribosomal protein S18 acetylase RimI-like enzyme
MAAELFVRPAVEDDSSVIEGHRIAARHEAQNYRGSLQDGGLSENQLSFVGGFGTTIMGSLMVSVTDNQAHIGHVFVVPEAREVGLADSLLQHVISVLRTKGITQVGAQALPGDRAMKNLFERHGLIAQTIIVGKSL